MGDKSPEEKKRRGRPPKNKNIIGCFKIVYMIRKK